MVLAEYCGAGSLRELARLAQVSPSSAHRIVAKLSKGRVVVWHRHTGVVELAAATAAEIRAQFAQPKRTPEDQLEYLRGLAVELWLIEPEWLATKRLQAADSSTNAK